MTTRPTVPVFATSASFAGYSRTRHHSTAEPASRTLVFRSDGHPDDRNIDRRIRSRNSRPAGAAWARFGACRRAWNRVFGVAIALSRSNVAHPLATDPVAPQARHCFLVVLIVMVPLGYQTTIATVQRGYDLSGDQVVGFGKHGASLDAQTASVFNLIDLASFALLALSGLWFRRRPAIHKRLMLFANIQLVGASLTHLLGHTGLLTAGTIIGSFSLVVLAVVARDWLVESRVHPLSTALAVLSVLLLVIEGALIGPSATWHHLIDRLAAKV